MHSAIRFSVLSIGLITNSTAVGFRLPNQDPEAIARGNAFTATADNPSAIYYNPAGITQLDGHQLSVGLYAISTGIDFESPLGARARADSAFQFVPQIYYTFSPDDSPISYGLGLFAPYGLAVDYGRNTPFSTVAIDGELAFITLNPTVAYQVNPQLSLGLGLAINYSDISLTRSLVGAPGDFFDFEGDDFSLGFNAGVLWQPSEQWSFGLNFRSATELNYRGESRANLTVPLPLAPGVTVPPGLNESSTRGSLDFPMNIALGVSYRPTEKWNFEVGFDWTDWDSVDVTTLEGTFFGDVDFPFNYESGFMYQVGVTRSFDSGHFLSAGYIYSDNSVPDQFFSPLNPDSNLHLLNLGFGKRSDVHSYAISYTVAYNGGSEVEGNESASLVGETADGTYESLNHAINVSYRYSF